MECNHSNDDKRTSAVRPVELNFLWSQKFVLIIRYRWQWCGGGARKDKWASGKKGRRDGDLFFGTVMKTWHDSHASAFFASRMWKNSFSWASDSFVDSENFEQIDDLRKF